MDPGTHQSKTGMYSIGTRMKNYRHISLLETSVTDMPLKGVESGIVLQRPLEGGIVYHGKKPELAPGVRSCLSLPPQGGALPASRT